MKKNINLVIKLLALVLVFSLVSPIPVGALSAENNSTRASVYLDSYNTYICAMGGGDLQIWFTVVGDDDMDEIGTLSIVLYESSDKTNWTRVKTYSHENYSSMLATDDWIHSSYVPYDGIAGKYYKAYVCIWAGRNGTGDTRYMWTAVERAT